MSDLLSNIYFLDLQTTGARPGAADILEVSWKVAGGVQRSYLVQLPEERPLPRRIQSLTGISKEDLSSARPLKDILSDLESECAGMTAVIHYAQFERPFLNECIEKMWLKPLAIVCTHEIAKRLFPNLPARGIRGLAGYFGFNAGEFKRASCHVEATEVIWQNLQSHLKEQNLQCLSDVHAWLQLAPVKKRSKYEYPLAKEKRLTLPKEPGVYRMISQWGEVLYVGKATSLHDRVNSYFRGQKNRDSRKLEMLTQTWELQVTPCRSPLEAALLETDEIKRLNPRYNISLKAGQRGLIYFSTDFLSWSSQQDEEHPVGPFSSLMVLDSMLKLREASASGEWSAHLFFDEIDPELLRSGFEVFVHRWGIDASSFQSFRSILAFGFFLLRQKKEQTEEDFSEESEKTDELAEAIEEGEEWTPEALADRFERHLVRAASAYSRSKKLTRLLNANILYEEDGASWTLCFCDGQTVEAGSELKKLAWVDKTIEDYDRMSVLLSELEKVRSRGGFYSIQRKEAESVLEERILL